jgi:hypothetical protein
VELDSPSEYHRGAPPDSALAVIPPALASGSGRRLSWGFCAPSTLALRVPPSSATTGANAVRGRRGLPGPRRCRPRAFSAPRRFEPRRPARPGFPRVRSRQRLPRNYAALFHAANVLGVRPTEPSPLGEPYRLPAAVASLRVRARPCRGAVARARREGFRCALDPEPRRGHEAHDRDRRDGDAASRPRRRPSNTTRVAPRQDSTAAHVTGLADHTAGSPASKPCSLRESVLAATRPSRRSLRPVTADGRRAVALLGLRPSGAFSTTSSGPVDREAARRTGLPRKTTPHSGSGARRFDPEA